MCKWGNEEKRGGCFNPWCGVGKTQSIQGNVDACVFLPNGVLTITASFDVEELAQKWIEQLKTNDVKWSETTVLLTSKELKS